MEELTAAVGKWKPQHAYENYLLSLERLDWRWSIEYLLHHLSLESESLKRELDEIKSKLERAKSG